MINKIKAVYKKTKQKLIDVYKTCEPWLDKFNVKVSEYVNMVGMDKILHASISANLVVIFWAFGMSLLWAYILTLVIGIFREMFGNQDVGDISADIVGTFLMCLILVFGVIV